MRPSNGVNNAPIELSDGNPSSSDDEEVAPVVKKLAGPTAAQRAQAEMEQANRAAKLQALAMVDGGDLFDESDDGGEEVIPARRVGG
jgi:hypothetical protein